MSVILKEKANPLKTAESLKSTVVVITCNHFIVDSDSSFYCCFYVPDINALVIGFFDKTGVFCECSYDVFLKYCKTDAKLVQTFEAFYSKSFECLTNTAKVRTAYNSTLVDIDSVPVSTTLLRPVFITLVPGEHTICDFIERYNFAVSLCKPCLERETVVVLDVNSFYIRYLPRKERLSALTPTMKALNMSNISDELKRFIRRINMVSIERAVDNKKRNTFDFVRIYIAVPSAKDMPDRQDFLKKHYAAIQKVIFGYLETHKCYTRYGVPVNFLKLSNCVFTHCGELELLYCLREV